MSFVYLQSFGERYLKMEMSEYQSVVCGNSR